MVAVAALCGWAGGARAAQFQAIDLPDNGGPAILMTGVIGYGDEHAFDAVASRMSNAMMVTTGPGGSVAAAIAIGTEIRNRGWSTLVPRGVNCASACSMIWLAGVQRYLAANAQIGFHAMSLIQQGHWSETHEADMYLRSWLTQLGYAMDATATIVNTHAASIRWYDATELNANGIATQTYP